MQIDFFSVLTSVLSLVILVIPGFILAKIGIFKKGADKVLSGIVLYIAQPALVFTSLQKVYDKNITSGILIVMGLTVLIHLVMTGLVVLFVKNKSKNVKLNCVKFATVFGNVGFMGLPFLQTLFKDNPVVQGEILIYCAMIIAVYNLLTWSIGIWLSSGDRKKVSLKKAFLNPTSITVYIGLFWFFVIGKPVVDLTTPGTMLNVFIDKIYGSIESIGALITPISMMVIGVRLADVNFKQLFADKLAYVTSINKLIICAFITTLIVGFLPISEVVKYAIFFSMAMPAAASAVLYAVEFGGDSNFASIVVLLSTILSIITIPLMFLVSKMIF